ncbi:uncharacterized protein Z519_08729 [Cladophialophora bantiana CBS 173.52]|uniref:Las1-like protein n=1 Tax=Cladophialophora bantiana (strain ATCC 10958 / CBS 173.52 / CDC B-1940 / NIH 8579) TaxID=1442370 RepID=A0A0D2ELU3_CLAB1|nr:uncharacterized protein Z519_08729 [Cladophialophora bantiana CBS 173.52]KIW90946.1 hypothetical protein Z519_08729 [Cladophialophora bantiana CBS 173.52]
MILQFPPWRHDSELAMVRDWFFPNHAKQEVFSSTIGSDSSRDIRQRAIDRVNLWLFKAGQLPPAMVATASLTEALIHDERRRSSSGTAISDSAMQSIYAMAFARFVNGFVDRDVARSYAAEMARDDTPEGEDVTRFSASAAKGESSMYAHAATIGMPQTFVDLRHQVTHADIPNLMYLRQMTEQALGWMWERWWVKNVTGRPERALRELEDRRRVSRRARDARESTQKGSRNMMFQNDPDSDGQGVSTEATLVACTSQNEPELSSTARSRYVAKRKAAALDDDN